jgi:stearoyl-CoA desaturase (delta-9 desaturase)
MISMQFRCPDWIKVAFLVSGSWAIENSALKWSANHAQHHACVDQEEDLYNATKRFWHSHCAWFFTKSPYRTERYAPWLREDSLVMWQHPWYVPLLLSGLALPFLVGYFSNGWIGGMGCFMMAGAGRIVGKSALQSVQFQSEQLVGVAHHTGRGIP